MPGGAQTPGEPQQPMPGSPQNPGAAGMAPEQTPLQNFADQSFLRNTMENNEAQVRMSRLAEQKSSSQDIKQFSQQMVKVHTDLDTQLQPVAKKLNVEAPKGPSKKEKKEIAKLQDLSGPAFDSAYIEDMANEQQQSLKQFHDEGEDSQNPALQQAVKQDTPILDQHLQVLDKIAQAHNVDIEAKKKK